MNWAIAAIVAVIVIVSFWKLWNANNVWNDEEFEEYFPAPRRKPRSDKGKTRKPYTKRSK